MALQVDSSPTAARTEFRWSSVSSMQLWGLMVFDDSNSDT
jgi:hypothetical protein